MPQDNTSELSSLASFATLQELLAARGQQGSTEAILTFEAFEVQLGHAMRNVENELKAIDAGRRPPENRGTANAGKILGIVGTVILALWVVALIFILLFAIIAATTNS